VHNSQFILVDVSVQKQITADPENLYKSVKLFLGGGALLLQIAFTTVGSSKIGSNVVVAVVVVVVVVLAKFSVKYFKVYLFIFVAILP
jgi:hypothetical protein